MYIDVRSNADKIAKEFGDLATNQLPFATARALTWTATSVQKNVLFALPRVFTIRNRFLHNSVRITPAKKSDLTSEVGFRTGDSKKGNTDFMQLQVDGGIKKPQQKHVSLPRNARKNKNEIITRSNRPRAILNKPRIFRIDEQHQSRGKKNLPFGIYQRTGRGGHGEPKLLFRFAPQTMVQQRLDLEGIAAKVVSNRFPKLFTMSLDDAIKNAR
jgi:hypothetical protein